MIKHCIMRTVLALLIASQSVFWAARSFGRWVWGRCMKILDLWCYTTVLLQMSQKYFLYFVNFCSPDSARRRVPPSKAPDMFWRYTGGVLVSAVTNGILFLIYPCHFRCWITSAVYSALQNNELSRDEPLSGFGTVIAVAATESLNDFFGKEVSPWARDDSVFLWWSGTESTITEATTGLMYQSRMMMDGWWAWSNRWNCWQRKPKY
jgi:hypothetical protein